MDTVLRLIGMREVTAARSKLPAVGCTNPELICGIELEIENVGRLERAIDMCDPKVWHVVEDGSLRPRNHSWEFVSYPMRMEHIIPELEKFFKNPFGENNYSDRTSVHVHTNVQDYTPKELAVLALVYTTVEDFLFEFVNQYNKGDRESYFRDTNLYCIPWTQCRMNHELVRNFLANTEAAVRRWEKYTALNLIPIRGTGTVEWRHMHGTNDMDKLTKWLNIIGSIMKYAKTNDFDKVVKTITSLNDSSAYQLYFDEVFGNILPYNEDYARRLSEGVINAKYALMNKDKKEEPGKPKRDEWFEQALAQNAQELADMRAQEALQRQANDVRGLLAAARPPGRPAPGQRNRRVGNIAAQGEAAIPNFLGRLEEARRANGPAALADPQWIGQRGARFADLPPIQNAPRPIPGVDGPFNDAEWDAVFNEENQ
jgi:hypothetical protein